MSPTIVYKEDTRNSFKKCVKKSVATDIVFFWIRHQGCWGVMDKAEMTQEMKNWRKMALKGEIAMIRHNNQDDITFEGIKMWSFCLQSYKNGEIDAENNVLDAYGGFVFVNDGSSFRSVSGHLYGFKSKANRDAVFEYVMKGIELKKYGIEVPVKTKKDDTYEKMSDVE